MAIDVIGLAVAKAAAENQGAREPESTRIGVIGALAGSPVTALVLGRVMGEQQKPAEDAPAAAVAAAPLVVVTDPVPDPGKDATDWKRPVEPLAWESAGDAQQALAEDIRRGFRHIESRIEAIADDVARLKVAHETAQPAPRVVAF